VAAASLACLVASSAPAGAQTARPSDSALARAGVGSIRGLVLDTRGRPLVGAMVSALGSTVAFALTGRDGRFLLDALPPGAYTVRVHLDGFTPSPRRMVDVRPSAAPSVVSVALKSLATAGSTPDGRPVLAAGLIPLDGAGAGAASDASASDADDQDHGETAWRLRHLKRGVLKGIDIGVAAAGETDPVQADPGSFLGRAFGSSARLASSLFNDFPLTGQVNLVTTSVFGQPFDPLTPSASVTATSVAYISLGASAGPLGNWAIRGATTPGNVGAWFIDGSLAARSSSAHRYAGGVTYSTQRINATDPFALGAIGSASRSVGRAYGLDEWVISKRVTVGYGLSYMWQDYLVADRLLSPRLSMTVAPASGLRVRAVASRSSFAPGAQEFLRAMNSPAGVWLPAQRSFSPWSDREPLRAQRTDHVELGIEHDIAAYVVGVRAFRQHVGNQAGALFAAPSVEQPAASLGHYYLATIGDLGTRGWGVRVSRPFLGFLRGSVDYSVSRAEWLNGSTSAMTAWFGDNRRTGPTRVRDLTTSLETDIAQTSTRVFVLYKVNSGFAKPSAGAHSTGPDRRFDVQINQGLPFLNFTQADWEVLVAVCNFFGDAEGERSIYDELLVIRPPTRVVGGVRVRF
jgi:hypothetical protein